jgi:hypothetical protein
MLKDEDVNFKTRITSFTEDTYKYDNNISNIQEQSGLIKSLRIGVFPINLFLLRSPNNSNTSFSLFKITTKFGLTITFKFLKSISSSIRQTYF